jgi:hypothetical protein
MVTLRLEQASRQTPGFSNRQWLWAIALVAAAHLLSLSHDWGLAKPATEENHYLPIDVRAIELVDEPQGGKSASPVRKAPKPLSKPVPAAADPLATPASVAQFEPVPEAAPAPVPEVESAQALAPAQPAVSAVAAAASLGAETDPNAAPGAAGAGASESPSAVTAKVATGVEKVVLTVPNVVKFPDNRSWTFSTTHKSPKVNAPNLSTDFRWKVENGQYEVYLGAASLYAAFTKLSRQSKGAVGDVGLQPATFTATQRDGTRTVSYFDPVNQRVIFGAPGRPPMLLLPGAQDELSAAVQLSTMFLGEPQRYQAGDRIVMPVVQRTDAQVWLFKVEGEEQLEIPKRSIRTVKLTRAPRSEFDTAVTIWLAPEQQYMPVRLRLDYSAERSDDMLWKGF